MTQTMPLISGRGKPRRLARAWFWVWGAGLWLGLSGCGAPAPLPLVATEALAATPALEAFAPFDTPTPLLEAPAATPVFVPTLLPETGPVAVPTINAEDPLRFTFPTPVVFHTPENWRPPVQGVPLSVRSQDHFWFARPIASDSVNWPLGSYRYGSDYFGQMNVHAGIDIDAPLGTPILASGPGQVIWAGWGLFNFDPRRIDDPYGIAVAIRHDYGFQGRNLYTLYAHMETQANLFVGQRVETGQLLGWVGVTGNTTGPHVHFEVRVGENGYYSTRNPEMWIAPYAGWGVLAGQVLDKAGRYIYSQPIEIYDARDRWVATVFTYGDRVARADEGWRENFAISDLPAGRYRLKVTLGLQAPPPFPITPAAGVENAASIPGLLVPPVQVGEVEVLEGTLDVIAGQTNFVLLQSGVGQVAGALPAETRTPVYPTDTPTATNTPTLTFTPTATRTPRPSATPTVTRTPRPSPTPTRTRTPSATPLPTRTPPPTRTP